MIDILVKVFFYLVVTAYRHKTGVILAPGRSLSYLELPLILMLIMRPPVNSMLDITLRLLESRERLSKWTVGKIRVPVFPTVLTLLPIRIET